MVSLTLVVDIWWQDDPLILSDFQNQGESFKVTYFLRFGFTHIKCIIWAILYGP